ncbi:MAG: hypothetical protein V3S51_05070, partial [Dehalococcoidia bacterium]
FTPTGLVEWFWTKVTLPEVVNKYPMSAIAACRETHYSAKLSVAGAHVKFMDFERFAESSIPN